MIDNLNHKIIISLKRDGRYSYARLAKELGVNVATVTRRIDKLLEEDLIKIETVLNPFNLGLNTHAFITLDIDLSKVDQVCAQLADNFNISLVATIFGRFDVLIIADFPSMEMRQEFITKYLPHIQGISQIDTFPIVEIKKIYSVLFKNNSSVNTPITLDDIDRRIIEELRKNGRLSYAHLANKLNINLTTVSRRIARLKKEEIIKISAVRNPTKWGYLANAYIVLHADLNRIDRICAELSVYPEVSLIATLMSGFEILAGINLPSPEEMYKFTTDKVARIEGVFNLETFFCAEIRKRSYALFDPEKEW